MIHHSCKAFGAFSLPVVEFQSVYDNHAAGDESIAMSLPACCTPGTITVNVKVTTRAVIVMIHAT